MATKDTSQKRSDLPVRAPKRMTVRSGRGILARYRERKAAPKRTRLLSTRNRRTLAKWLRRTAKHTQQPHPLARRREPLLHYRVAAVRNDLLEIAAMLENAPDPDPASVTELQELLANGCDSPLYNPDIHVSELRATLHYARAGLLAQRTPQPTEGTRRPSSR
jgi:hypothetical protein